MFGINPTLVANAYFVIIFLSMYRGTSMNVSEEIFLTGPLVGVDGAD